MLALRTVWESEYSLRNWESRLDSRVSRSGMKPAVSSHDNASLSHCSRSLVPSTVSHRRERCGKRTSRRAWPRCVCCRGMMRWTIFVPTSRHCMGAGYLCTTRGAYKSAPRPCDRIFRPGLPRLGLWLWRCTIFLIRSFWDNGMNPYFHFCCAVHFWVELKACTWQCCSKMNFCKLL
jgi:hypothetical protein